MGKFRNTLMSAVSSIFHNFSRYASRIEKNLRIENGHLYISELFDHRRQVSPQT